MKKEGKEKTPPAPLEDGLPLVVSRVQHTRFITESLQRHLGTIRLLLQGEKLLSSEVFASLISQSDTPPGKCMCVCLCTGVCV